MWSFTLLAAVLVALTLALLLRPLLSRRSAAGSATARDAKRSVHRERRHETQARHAAGHPSPEESRPARDEVADPLLADTALPAENPPRPWRSVLGVALGVPVLGIALYLHLGEWRWLLEEGRAPDAGRASAHLEALEEAVRMNPRDAQGWTRLGRAAVALERYHHGLLAFTEAHRLQGDDPDLLADYAEAEALLTGYRFQGEVVRRLERALELDPRHAKALWLAGFAALQNARPELAIARWETLAALLGADLERARVVEALIARTREETGAEAGTEGAPEAPPVLVVRVRLDEGFAGEVDGSESLFVFARALDGPPAPLVVRRESARELPLTLRLDDSMSMLPDRNLSSAGRVRVGARLSRSGNALAGSGDIQGLSEAIELRAGENEVVVVLNERLP